jgi:TRAP-type C4-dicarboxylate transport system permease small subunit
MLSRVRRLLGVIHKGEDWLLALLALLLVVIATGQIAVRVVGATLPHADLLLKTTVLWLAMLGAMTAAREGKHLGMDALLHVIPHRVAQLCKAIGFVFAAYVCVKFCQYGYQFVMFERENPSGAAHDIIASWVVLCAFPVGFGGMALRFALQALIALMQINAEPAKPSEVAS